jgi:hypothetical protein
MKYRNEQVEKQMELIEFMLTAISEKKSSKLEVNAIMNEDHLMSYDKAIRIGMQRKANESMIATKALAMGFDRVVAMVGQMIAEMKKSDMANTNLYENRLKVLTNFKRIMDELNPEMARHFAHKGKYGQVDSETY